MDVRLKIPAIDSQPLLVGIDNPTQTLNQIQKLIYVNTTGNTMDKHDNNKYSHYNYILNWVLLIMAIPVTVNALIQIWRAL